MHPRLSFYRKLVQAGALGAGEVQTFERAMEHSTRKSSCNVEPCLMAEHRSKQAILGLLAECSLVSHQKRLQDSWNLRNEEQTLVN